MHAQSRSPFQRNRIYKSTTGKWILRWYDKSGKIWSAEFKEWRHAIFYLLNGELDDLTN